MGLGGGGSGGAGDGGVVEEDVEVGFEGEEVEGGGFDGGEVAEVDGEVVE